MPADTESEEARKAAEIAEIRAREAEANALEAEALVKLKLTQKRTPQTVTVVGIVSTANRHSILR